MLELTLSNIDAPDDPIVTLHVSARSRGAIGDYTADLFTPAGDYDELRIADYPRWFESAGSLCGRFLRDYLNHYEGLGEDLPLPVTSFVLMVRIVPSGRFDRARLLEQHEVVHGENGWVVTSNEQQLAVPDVPGNLVGVAMNALRVLAYGDKPFPDPVPLEVPVHVDGTLRYVLMREIPEPAQTAFRKNMHHSTRPYVAGGDAAYAWDWEDFLDGTR